MKKIEVVKEWLRSEDNLKWILKQLDLFLSNNHGSEIADMYSTLQGEINELLNKENVKKMKWIIINDVLEIVRNGIAWDYDTEISESTIKKGMKETGFYTQFNNMFINSLEPNGNVDLFKKHFIKK